MADTSTYTLLQRISVSATVSSVTFSSIPQTGYTDLKIVASTRNTASNTLGLLNVRFNGLTTNLSSIVLYGFGSNAGTSSYSGVNYAIWGYTNGATSTSNVFANTEFIIPNYTSSNYKSVSVDSVNENNATDGRQSLTAGLWSSTAAITSITLDALDGGAGAQNFVEGCTFSLYATSALGTTPGTPKALGGDIVRSDGTYWYHAFLNTGTFTPQSPLTCDMIVVAGGGGGAAMDYGMGGGGAGGLLNFSSQSLSVSEYACTVGAGGAGQTVNNIPGLTGNDSQFGSLTLVKGGGYGGASNNGNSTGGTGGSGGGGGAGGTALGGSATSGQGNAGGNGYTAQKYTGGGGGGAGAAGGNGNATSGGGGGIGTNTYSTWASATSTGVNTGYYAGGGGGGVYATYGGGDVPGTGGSGGGGTGTTGFTTPASISGTPNTGGGGGGGGGSQNGGNGGSGIIIIRYAV